MVLLLALIAGVASLVLTGAVRAYALRNDLLDRPNARSSHSTPTPRGGGVAMVAAATLGIATSAGLGVTDTRHAVTLGIGMIVLAVTGWLDDTRGIGAGARLSVHAAVACWTLYMFGGLSALRIGETTLNIGMWGYVLGGLGIVWSINLFNFMDGIDGIAGSQALLIFGTAATLLFARGDQSLAAMAIVLAAAAAGFLVWNWPPAKIFMGDAGSGAIGYLVAGLAIASENDGSVPLFAFAILGGLFIADATVTLVRRVLRGNRPTEAHRDHAYQRLTRLWGSHRPVTIAAALVTMVLGMLAAVGTLAPRLLLPAFVAASALVATLLVTADRRAPT